MLDFQHINQVIKEKLFEISYKIKCFNKAGDIDISRYAETIFKEILNVIYFPKNWKFEKAIKINQDTYDLYDESNKVCIQITSNIRNQKKVSSIKKFHENLHSKKFDTFIIIFISEKKPQTKDNIIKDFIYKDYNIIELSSQIESECKKESLIEIRDILYFDYNRHAPFLGSNSLTKDATIEDAEKSFLRNIKLESDLKRDLLIKDYYHKITGEELMFHPYKKFWSSRFTLRSIKDETYPEINENSEWERTFMYDFYDRGICIWIAALSGYKAVVNGKGEWFVKEFTDKRKIPQGSRLVKIRIIGKLPFDNIVHYKLSDEYTSEPHLYCKFIGVNNSPFEKIIYVIANYGDYSEEELDWSKKID